VNRPVNCGSSSPAGAYRERSNGDAVVHKSALCTKRTRQGKLTTSAFTRPQAPRRHANDGSGLATTQLPRRVMTEIILAKCLRAIPCQEGREAAFSAPTRCEIMGGESAFAVRRNTARNQVSIAFRGMDSRAPGCLR
jgi:hypothetical protein